MSFSAPSVLASPYPHQPLSRRSNHRHQQHDLPRYFFQAESPRLLTHIIIGDRDPHILLPPPTASRTYEQTKNPPTNSSPPFRHQKMTNNHQDPSDTVTPSPCPSLVRKKDVQQGALRPGRARRCSPETAIGSTRGHGHTHSQATCFRDPERATGPLIRES